MRVKKEIVSVSYSKNHSNFNYCCSFYVRKKGVNFLFDAIDDATVTIVEIIFSDKNSMSVSMTEQTLDSLEKAFFALAEKYCKDV